MSILAHGKMSGMDASSSQCLRASNIRLEHENVGLRTMAIQLEKEMTSVREQLESERRLTRKLKNDKRAQAKTIREKEEKKWEKTIFQLRTRMEEERSMCLENQRIQLENDFQIQLKKLTHQKDRQIHLICAHSLREKREAEKRRVNERVHYAEALKNRLNNVEREFQKRLNCLSIELKRQQVQNEALRVEVRKRQMCGWRPMTNIAIFQTTTEIACDLSSSSCAKKLRKTKSYQERRRMIQNPNRNQIDDPLELRHDGNMREMEEFQPLEHQQFFYHHFSGPALETLPEAESEEECSEGEDVSESSSGAPCTTTSCSSQASDDNFCLSHVASIELMNGHQVAGDDASGTSSMNLRYESSPEDSHHKIVSLEDTIRQLREELRECKDQNELLEFRLLEIEELDGTTTSQAGKDGRKCGKNNRIVETLLPSKPPLYDDGIEEEPAVVTIRRNYGTESSSHASVVESRSSCSSDCSDSLSLQESGIFDSQSVNDDFHGGIGNRSGSLAGLCNILGTRDDMSRELGNLTSQIENLVIRFTEEGNDSAGGQSENEINGDILQSGSSSSSSCLSRDSETSLRGFEGNLIGNTSRRNENKTKGRKGTNIRNELKTCWRRIKEFETRLSQLADINYTNSLEDKVSLLINNNQRLAEEKCELEEAENDSRHQCQRLEEEVLELGQKHNELVEELSSEKSFVEQLRVKIGHLQQREEDLSAQILRVDALVQDFEDRNFELEESCIDVKCSLQFVVNSLPVLVLWYLWAVLKRLQLRHTSIRAALRHNNFSSLTSSEEVSCVSRKHKLLEQDVASVEPILKKLRAEEKCHNQRNNLTKKQTDASTPPVGETNLEGETSLSQIICPVELISRDSQVQTSEESWKGFIDEIILMQRKEWEQVEKALHDKITLLEAQIVTFETSPAEPAKTVFQVPAEEDQEAIHASALEDSHKFLQERKALQEKWENLIRELQGMVASPNTTGTAFKDNVSHANNNCHREDSNSCKESSNDEDVRAKSHCSSDNDSNSNKVENSPLAVRAGSGLVADRIRALFPGEWKKVTRGEVQLEVKSKPWSNNSNSSSCSAKGENNQQDAYKKNLVVSRLEQAFMEQVNKFEAREKALVDEISALRREMKISKDVLLNSRLEKQVPVMKDAATVTCDSLREPVSTSSVGCGTEEEPDYSEIVYLSEENNRLQILLSDQESIVNRVRELEEENESLGQELAASLVLKKRLDDAYGVENALRNRIEELEVSEMNAKEVTEETERRERRCIEKLTQLREEAQFLRNKSCQLQEELDSKISSENKYNNEILSLKLQVRTLNSDLEEKESMLENNISLSQTQITKLKGQLQKIQEQFGELECSNSMLREEVQYLEKTLQDETERSAKTVSMLQSELRQQEENTESLQRELSQTVQKSAIQEVPTCNDLDVFAQNEGGLFGVERDIKSIALQIQDGFPELMSRCESIDYDVRTSPVPSESLVTVATKNQVIVNNNITTVAIFDSKCPLEDTNVQVCELEEAVAQLQLKMMEMEDVFRERTKNLEESSRAEACWYNWRCRQKNDMIKVLARRIAHLSATDRHGIFLDSILTEIKLSEREKGYSTIFQVGQFMESNKCGRAEIDLPMDANELDLDFTSDSLALFLNIERQRIMDLMENPCQEYNQGLEASSVDEDQLKEKRDLEFRVCKRLSEDSLLVTWSVPEDALDKIDGYEIFVNETQVDRIPKRDVFQAVLTGLNLSEPLQLQLKCSGADDIPACTVTYIA